MLEKTLFDRVLCIGQAGKERTELTLARCRAQGLNIQLFPAIMMPDHAAGCWASHMNIWRQALADNIKYLLVFEDDARFLRDYDESIIRQFIHKYPNFNVLYLGHSAIYLSNYDEELQIAQAHCLDLHAYIINCQNKSWFTKLCKYQYNHHRLPIDALMSVQPKCYAFSPMWVIQDERINKEPGQTRQLAYEDGSATGRNEVSLQKYYWYLYNYVFASSIPIYHGTIIFLICLILLIFLLLIYIYGTYN